MMLVRLFRFLRALSLRALLLPVTLLLLGATPLPPEPASLTVDLAAHRPMQALYQIKTQVAQSGWNADLAQAAGDIWESLDDLSLAVSYWQIALRLRPSDVQLTRRLAQAQLDLEQWSQAVIMLSNLLKLEDDNWAHFQLGVLQSVLDSSSAIEHFQFAGRDAQYKSITSQLIPLLKEPSDVRRAMQVGAALAGAKYWSAAGYVFQYAASLSPQSSLAFAYYGLARDQQGKDGRPQIDQAIRLASDDAQVRYLQGLHLHLTGDDDGSLQALQQATHLDPLNPAYAAELANTYDRLGDSVNAEYWYKAAVTLSNNDPRFQALLTTFYAQPSVTIVTVTPTAAS